MDLDLRLRRKSRRLGSATPILIGCLRHKSANIWAMAQILIWAMAQILIWAMAQILICVCSPFRMRSTRTQIKALGSLTQILIQQGLQVMRGVMFHLVV